VSLGANLTDGNSETKQLNGSVIGEGENRLGSVRAGVEGNYGKSKLNDVDETTAKNAKAFAQARKTLTEMTYAYLEASVLYDDIASIDYRATAGPGLGLYLIKSDATKLSVEAGLSYITEDVGDEKDDYVAARAAERFERRLSENAKMWESVEYMPQIDDTANYLLNSEVGAEAAMAGNMSLRLVVQDRYDSTPAPDRKENDLSVIAALSWKL
jgi:putative salt-induced outer membrane protein YdiY